MKKTIRIISSLGMMLFLSFLVFSLSSKTDPSDFTDYTSCEDKIGAGDAVKLKILFNEAANPNPFRKQGYSGYIPTPDLRKGNFPGASSLGDGYTNTSSEVQNYYAAVTITSPQCDKWEWKRVFDVSNGDSNGNMNVKIPINGYDVRVQIKYYERIDNQFNSVPDFNKDVYNFTCGNSSNTRVLYTFDQVFMNGWGGNIPQPMLMIPTSNNPLTCIDISGKYTTMADYNTVNDFIDINNLNPK